MKTPFSLIKIVGTLSIVSLLGAGCFSKPEPTPVAMPEKVALSTEAEVDMMSDEERANAMEEFMKENEPAAVDPATKDQAIALADEMKTMATEKSGEFHKVVHGTKGSARIVKNGDGWAVVFSDDFAVDAGPDLHVYVSGNTDPRTSPQVHEDPSADLGRLVSTSGGQAYQLPAGIDPDKINSIVIYCKPFKVVFAVATLQ